jgi:hypothetical protein
MSETKPSEPLTPQPYVDDGQPDDDGKEVDVSDLDNDEEETG